MEGCSNILQCQFWGPGLCTIILVWRQLSWFWCNLWKRGEEEERLSMVLPGRLGPHWLSSGNPPLWEGATWLCLLGWSRGILLPLAAPVKGNGINILRWEFVHRWEMLSHKIGIYYWDSPCPSWNVPRRVADVLVRMPLVLVSACMFLLVSCFGEMWGFEVVWTDLTALRYNIAHCKSAKDDLTVSWPIVGWFKSCHGILDCYMTPIAGVTNLGIQFFTWTQQFLRWLGQEGFEDVWEFWRPDKSRAKASDYQDNIFWMLEIIQATTTLIDSGCSIWDEYSVLCSGWHFFTTRSSNMKVDKPDTELQCRWSTDRANGVRTVQQSVIHN